MASKSSPISRVLKVAIISGTISGLIVTAIMWFFLASPWFFFIIPLIMGWTIKKFSHITADEVESNPELEKNTGWICAGIILIFVLLTALLTACLTYIYYGSWGYIFLNIPFYIVSGISVWYGYRQGVAAVVNSYYDSKIKEE